MIGQYREKIYKNYINNQDSCKDVMTLLKMREPFIRTIINRYIPPKKNLKILELGCGYGSFLFFLKEYGYIDCIGVDTSDEQLEMAHSLGIDNVIKSDLMNFLLNAKDSSYEIIIAIDILEHFTKDEINIIANHLFRILTENGMIVTHQPNATSPFGMRSRYGDFSHEIAFTRNSIKQIFSSNGFQDIRAIEDKPIPHSFFSIVRLILWELIVRNIYRFLIAVESGYCEKDEILSQNFLSIIYKNTRMK